MLRVCVRLIHHLSGRRPLFFFCLNLKLIETETFSFLSSLSPPPVGWETSLEDVALVSRGVKPLRVTLLMICQILGERELPCRIERLLFLSRFVSFNQPLLGCRCLSLFLLIYCIAAIYGSLASHPRFSLSSLDSSSKQLWASLVLFRWMGTLL